MAFGKKGLTTVQFFAIGEALIAVLVLAAMLNYVADVTSDSKFEQNFMARDLGLIIDTAYAAPGKLSYTYDTTVDQLKMYFLVGVRPVQNFTFFFDDSRVFVFNRNPDEVFAKPAEYFFGQDTHIGFSKPQDGNIHTLEANGDQFNLGDMPINGKKDIKIEKSGEDFKITLDGSQGVSP